jgi:hypothetical protein
MPGYTGACPGVITRARTGLPEYHTRSAIGPGARAIARSKSSGPPRTGPRAPAGSQTITPTSKTSGKHPYPAENAAARSPGSDSESRKATCKTLCLSCISGKKTNENSSCTPGSGPNPRLEKEHDSPDPPIGARGGGDEGKIKKRHEIQVGCCRRDHIEAWDPHEETCLEAAGPGS